MDELINKGTVRYFDNAVKRTKTVDEVYINLLKNIGLDLNVNAANSDDDDIDPKFKKNIQDKLKKIDLETILEFYEDEEDKEKIGRIAASQIASSKNYPIYGSIEINRKNDLFCLWYQFPTTCIKIDTKYTYIEVPADTKDTMKCQV